MDVYTDGSAFPHPQGYGGWAAVWEGTEPNIYHFIAGGGYVTNSQRMEMMAVSKVLSHFHLLGIKNVTVHTDCKDYIVNYSASLQPDISEKLVNYESKFQSIEYKYVKSHGDNVPHNLADQLACYKRIEFTGRAHEGLTESEDVEVGTLDINLFNVNHDSSELRKSLVKCFSLVINEKPYASFLSLEAAQTVKNKLLLNSNVFCKIIETTLH